MTKIVHLIQLLSTGGALRADLAAIKYLSRDKNYIHTFVSLCPQLDDPEAKSIAATYGVAIEEWQNIEEFKEILRSAEIVHLNYWNCPEIDKFLESDLPEMRLLGWFHIGGHTPPQYIPAEVLSKFDFIVACSPHTLDSPGFIEAKKNGLPTGMAYGAADFERLTSISKTPHSTFNIGYIGTVNFLKMYRRFIPISASASIPNVKFIVCGSGGDEENLRKEAELLGVKDKFEIKGYVSDINSVLSSLDAYGYPLCEDTYAASEVNLQEVMYAGIPAVVFPYGGISKLIIHQETGLIANNEDEYRQYLEYLYINPSERQRIGDNAKKYATEVFGAKNAAKQLGIYYEELLKLPKNKRQSTIQPTHGHTALIKYLSYESSPFIASIEVQDEDSLFRADEKIKNSSELMKFGGIIPFQRGYPSDPFLNLWAGLALEDSNPQKSLLHYVEAFNNGLSHWRVLWYIAKAANKMGESQLCKEALLALRSKAPTFKDAEELSRVMGI